ncbi:VIT-domain-containing protein [Phanerochaete sordida]|uniref:VIT-domain-containing protein n=1 Tax=Phanerochaete sordida TaxID=48140 RepID=A0A9P3GG81_9APHY|nr:VIT-domain-containing protein [Phanerochaete sordida]
MTAADGTVITAVAKEKEQARREHAAAISQGYMTGLVEHVTDDIFTISLGALPSNQMITTEITYVLDLMDEEVTDQVRLQIPMYIGMRYGTVPQDMHGANQAPPERVTISVDVRMQGTVRSITSPTRRSQQREARRRCVQQVQARCARRRIDSCRACYHLQQRWQLQPREGREGPRQRRRDAPHDGGTQDCWTSRHETTVLPQAPGGHAFPAF